MDEAKNLETSQANQEEIRTSWEYIDNRLNHWHTKIEELQSICEHPNNTQCYYGDEQLVECYCPDCGKYWEVEA